MPRKPIPKGAAIRSAIILGAFCFVTSSPLFADPSNIPFRLHDHLIVVEGSIEELEGLNLVIDTGTTFTMISEEIAGKLHFKSETALMISWGEKIEMKSGVLSQIRVGETLFRDVETRVGDLRVAEGLKVDALIGLDLLRNCGLTVDYEQLILTFGAEQQIRQRSPFYPNLPFVPVKLKVQGEILTLLLDTGAPSLILFRNGISPSISIIRMIGRQKFAHLAGGLTAQRIRLTGIELSGSEPSTVSAHLADIDSSLYQGLDGVFSPVSLGLKRFQIDFQHRYIGWEL